MKNVLFLTVMMTGIVGCRSLTIEKNDPVIVEKDGVITVVPGGWTASYWSYGVFTTFGGLGLETCTNGLIRVSITDMNSGMSTNNVAVIDAAGKSTAEIAAAVVKALK